MDEHQYPLVTISGPPASGTSTLAEELAEELNYAIINVGDIFRRMADERNLSLSELTELSETDDSIDKELDARLEDIITAHTNGDRTPDGDGLIIESRLAAFHADGRANIAVHLHAPLEVRVSRIDGRTETVEDLARREESEAERYQNYYGIDITDRSVYDVIIDTSKVSESETVDQVKEALFATTP